MIELKFYRDDEYVYINNPDGTTKRVVIEDFEAMFDVDTAELPTYTSSDAGKVLVVNNDGTGLEWGEGGSTVLIVECEVVEDTAHNATIYTLNKTWKEIHDAYLNGSVIVNENGFYCAVLQCYAIDDTDYGVSYTSGGGGVDLQTNSEQGYPTFTSTHPK